MTDPSQHEEKYSPEPGAMLTASLGDERLQFRVPGRWIEERVSETETRFQDGPVANGLVEVRLMTLRADEDLGQEAVNRNLAEAAVEIFGGGGDAKVPLMVRKDGAAIIHRVGRDRKKANAMVLATFMVGRAVTPRRLRVAIFSIAYPAKREREWEVRRNLRAAEFAALGCAMPDEPPITPSATP